MFEKLRRFDTSTIILYIVIIAIASAFAGMAQSSLRIVSRDNRSYFWRRSRKGWYILSFFVLAFFACFSANGVDKDSYQYLFNVNTFGYRYTGVEPGFWLYIVLFKSIINNKVIFLISISLLTLIFVYKGIWDCKDRLQVGLAIFIFASQYYLQSFNLMRIYLAISILILGAKHVIDKNRIKYLIYILVACSIHYSAIFALMGYVVANFFEAFGKKLSKLFFICAFGVVLIISTFTIQVAANLIQVQNVVVDKYSIYLEQASSAQVGLKWIFNLVPSILILYFSGKIKLEKFIFNIVRGYTIIQILVSIMSYSIPVLGRAIMCFNLVQIILFPIIFERYRIYKKDNSKFRTRVMFTQFDLLRLLIYAYFALQLLLYMQDYIGIDGLDNFRFIWNG